jgi:hypothetical protein
VKGDTEKEEEEENNVTEEDCDESIEVMIKGFLIFTVLVVFINPPLSTLCICVLINRGLNNVLLLLLIVDI